MAAGDVAVTSDDLVTFLGEPSADVTRATLMIELALAACSVYVTPVPDAAKGLVLTIAARAYSNPQGLTGETVGQVSLQRGVSGGLYLTLAERRQLRRIAGGGGAFTIDVMPPTAGQLLPWWDTGVVPYVDAFDVPS